MSDSKQATILSKLSRIWAPHCKNKGGNFTPKLVCLFQQPNVVGNFTPKYSGLKHPNLVEILPQMKCIVYKILVF